MAQTVTIDNYGVKAHQRYASDQDALEPVYFKDANLIPQHSETAVAKSTLSSKWEELFETHLHRHPFANFTSPPGYLMMRNRFFSYSISPEFDWIEKEEEEKKDEHPQAEDYKRKIQSKTTREMPIALFEKDRSALLNLIDSIQSLNGLLKDIHARKLQYQKG